MPIVAIPTVRSPAGAAGAGRGGLDASRRAGAGRRGRAAAGTDAGDGTAYLPGVVGQPVPAFTIDPAMASLNAGTRQYQIVSGPNAGNIENHVITPVAGDTTGTKWRHTVGDRSVFLQLVPGQSLNIVTEDDGDQGVSTRYSPPEPLLVAGMNAGDSTSATLNVNVYDLSDPSDLEHQGP
ncbi:MAG: hypothetical protein U1E38_05565 [Rhodospirillales bacterium]